MMRAEESSLAESLTRLFEAMQRLVRESLRLARVQIKQEAERAVWLLAAGGLLLVGWALLNGWAALRASRAIGLEAALGLLALLNLGAGGALFAWRLRLGRASSSAGAGSQAALEEPRPRGKDGVAA